MGVGLNTLQAQHSEPLALLVEPDLEVLISGEGVLRGAGFKVLLCRNLDNAISILKARRLDLLIAPKSPECSKRMRDLRAEGNLNVPVLLTARDGESTLDLELGEYEGIASGLVNVPFDGAMFVKAARQAMAVPEPVPSTIPMLPAIESSDVFLRLPDRSTLVASHIASRLNESHGPQPSEQITTIFSACEEALADASFQLRLPDPIGPGGTVAAAGQIDKVPVDQIIQLARSVGWNARCHIERVDCKIDIYMVGGNVVFASQKNLNAFSLGRILQGRGVVSHDDIDQACQWNFPTRIGERLVWLGALRQDELSIALKNQTEELVYEVLCWDSGSFAIYADEPLPAEALDAQVTLSIEALLLEGMRRLDEAEKITGAIGGRNVLLDRMPFADEGKLRQVSYEARAMFSKLDRPTEVDTLLRMVECPTFDAFRGLDQLWDQQLVYVRPS